MIIASMLRTVLGALLLVAPFAFVFGLPWVQIGIWRDTETVTVALHFISGLSAASIAAMAVIGDRRAAAALKHPITMCLAAIFAATLLQAVLSPLTGFDAPRTMHGLLGHGIGGLWFLDCAVLFAGYLATGTPRWRKAHAASGAAAATAAIVWTITRDAWAHQPANGWIAPVAILAAVPMFAARPWLMRLIGVAVLAFGAVVSESAPLWLAVIVATFAIAVLARGRFALPQPQLRAAVLISTIAFLLGIPAGLALLADPLEAIATTQITPRTMGLDGIPSGDPRDHVSINAKPYGSLWSKARSARAVVENIVEHPLYLAVGRGWGSYPDILAEQQRTIPGRSFTAATDTSSRTLWRTGPAEDLYSDSLLLEALASLGGAGAVLLGLLLVSPFIWAGPRAPLPAAFLIISFGIVAATSPLRNMTAPFLAIAFASVSHLDRRRPSLALRSRIDLTSSLVAAGAGVSLVYFAGIMLGVANLEHQRRQALPLQVLNVDLCRPIAGHLAPSREINSALFQRFVNQGESEAAPFAWFARRILTTINYTCVMRDLAENGAGAAFLVSSLELRHRLLQASGNFPPMVAALDPEVKHWGEDIAHLLTIAPGRTDLIIPYVSWIIARGDKDASFAALSSMIPLSTNPADPVTTWLKAKRAEIAGNEGEYRSQMARALRAGIANLIPMRRSETDAFLRPEIAGR